MHIHTVVGHTYATGVLELLWQKSTLHKFDRCFVDPLCHGFNYDPSKAICELTSSLLLGFEENGAFSHFVFKNYP